MRARGQGVLAVVAVALLFLGGAVFTRLGPKAPGRAVAGSAPSGAWFCPHGGGKEWKATLYLANPGAEDSTARITSIGSSGLVHAPSSVPVPAGQEVRVSVPADERASSTFVEYFGGWIAAGWVALGGAGDNGAGAETCAPSASKTWFTTDNTTQQGEEADLIVMNPFAAAAVFDVVLYTANRAPIHSLRWTDLTLRSDQSQVLRLNDRALNEEGVMAEVDVTTGRVAAASLGITEAGGIRSAIGSPHSVTHTYLPVSSGTGQSQLVVGVPGDRGVRLSGTLMSKRAPVPVAQLVGAEQTGGHTGVYPVISDGPAAVDLQTRGGGRLVAGLRSRGVGNDSASTAGAAEPSSWWVVTPTVAGHPSAPGIVLVNPASTAAHATLHLITHAGEEPDADVVVTIPAGGTAGAPAGFLASAPDASVLVSTDGAALVAMGSSTSLGAEGHAVYAMAVGTPVPTRARSGA